jgi:endonuclease/exonuclease/phosphatase family metal-dependent hydrolase
VTDKPARGSSVWTPDAQPTLPKQDLRLRLLSFNIQVGMETRHYTHYVTRAWRHALPWNGHHASLDGIAELLGDYDFVALQEADAGSLRTRFVNQIEYLARRAGFAHWGIAVTRNLQPVAQHCLGYLSRNKPIRHEQHALPTTIPGRGAVLVELGPQAAGLRVIVTHLSLGAKARRRQLDYIGHLAGRPGPTVVMGDMNCGAEVLRQHAKLRGSGLRLPDTVPATFPSWRPRRSIDHVLVSADVTIHELKTLPPMGSDHLPLSVEIGVGTSG